MPPSCETAILRPFLSTAQPALCTASSTRPARRALAARRSAVPARGARRDRSWSLEQFKDGAARARALVGAGCEATPPRNAPASCAKRAGAACSVMKGSTSKVAAGRGMARGRARVPKARRGRLPPRCRPSSPRSFSLSSIAAPPCCAFLEPLSRLSGALSPPSRTALRWRQLADRRLGRRCGRRS